MITGWCGRLRGDWSTSEVASGEWQWLVEEKKQKNDEPRAFVREYAREATAKSEEWYAAEEVRDYRLDGENVLTFTSTLESAWAENNVVHAQFFPGKKIGPAVLILPNWNAKWQGQVALCHWLQRMGISALKMSLPYHDRRMAKGHERADQLVGPNIGLTLQANRQAVKDARACLTWLEKRGYDRLGILGTSIGSSVGYITLVHDKQGEGGGIFPCVHVFCGCGEPGDDDESCVGRAAARGERGGVAGVLGADQSDAVCGAGDGRAAEYVYGVREI